jgi:hypothetical protein
MTLQQPTDTLDIESLFPDCTRLNGVVKSVIIDGRV